MYTHSVISQRSPYWFYFLVKPTSSHTTSPSPLLAIQMYIQTAGHPERFIPMLLLFLFFFFFMFQSQIFIFWHLLCFVLIPEREKFPFPCPHSGTLWRQRHHGSQWSGQQDAGRQSNSHSRWEDGSKTIVFPKLWQHVNILTHSKAWHPGRKNANSGWGRHWDIFPYLWKYLFWIHSLHIMAQRGLCWIILKIWPFLEE